MRLINTNSIWCWMSEIMLNIKKCLVVFFCIPNAAVVKSTLNIYSIKYISSFWIWTEWFCFARMWFIYWNGFLSVSSTFVSYILFFINSRKRDHINSTFTNELHTSLRVLPIFHPCVIPSTIQRLNETI